MEKGFISASKAIKGYAESMIAKSENNDCVVRAIASASEMDYNSAHQFVKETFNRENGRPTFGFGTGMNLLSKNGKQINGKNVQIISEEYNTMSYYVVVKGVKKLRATTTSTFIKKYPVGTYVVLVRGHAFTIKDGIVIGNPDDSKKMKKHIVRAWKIG
jgi:hypothetical protein